MTGGNGGASALGGTAGSTSATGGAASGGSAGTSSGSGGTVAQIWSCPAGVTGRPTLGGTPTRVTAVPPRDAFNMDNGNFGNVEGPVWIGNALYVSEMSYMPYDQANPRMNRARILKVTDAGGVSIAIADSGSNGLAVGADGNIVAAVHKDGSITRYALANGAATPLVTEYMGARFNSPNDLAIRTSGDIYFTDPNFQAPNTAPQTATRVYRVAPNGTVTALPDNFGNPNGITLSLDENSLYVAAGQGRRYAINSDGSVGAGQNFNAASNADGMVIDCAGNLYVTRASTQSVFVYTADGSPIGQIDVPSSEGLQAVTNVAFGGADHKTLFITGLGNNKGLFRVTLDIPGRPY
jgi:gluconolactonase